MRSLRYLNGILTVLAVLLAMQLWTTWTGLNERSPLLVQQAQAAGVPDAGAQRQEIADLLKQLNQQTGELTSMFRNGSARVKVEGDKAGQ